MREPQVGLSLRLHETVPPVCTSHQHTLFASMQRRCARSRRPLRANCAIDLTHAGRLPLGRVSPTNRRAEADGFNNNCTTTGGEVQRDASDMSRNRAEMEPASAKGRQRVGRGPPIGARSPKSARKSESPDGACEEGDVSPPALKEMLMCVWCMSA